MGGKAMLIAQITDLHIGFDRGNAHELNVRRLNLVIDELNERTPRPELLLVTGDLVEHPDDVEAYRHMHALVGRWQGPKGKESTPGSRSCSRTAAAGLPASAPGG